MLCSMSRATSCRMFFLSEYIMYLFALSCDGSIAFSAKITSVGQKTFIILMKKASPRNGPVGEAFLLSFISEIHCSELLHIQILINQDAVDCFQVECNFAFRFQLDGEEIFRTFEHLFVSEIDESRIERLLTAGMQAVVCQVFHRTEVCRFDADKVIILLVVRQCETQSVDSFDTVTFDSDFDCFAGVVRSVSEWKGRSFRATRSVPDSRCRPPIGLPRPICQ